MALCLDGATEAREYFQKGGCWAGRYVEGFELDRTAHLSSCLCILECSVLCFPSAQHNGIIIQFIAAREQITTGHYKYQQPSKTSDPVIAGSATGAVCDGANAKCTR